MPEEGEKKSPQEAETRPPGETEAKLPEHGASPERLRQAWIALNLPLPAQIIGGIVATVAAALLLSQLLNDEKGSGGSERKPVAESATDEATQRDF